MSRKQMHLGCSCSRRGFLVRGLYGIGVGAGLPLVLSRTSAALAAQALEGTSVEKHPERILVVIELSGGNDGLSTLVPYNDLPAATELFSKIGDKIEFVVGYSDTTVHLHEEIVGVRDGRIASIWRVAGRGKIK